LPGQPDTPAGGPYRAVSAVARGHADQVVTEGLGPVGLVEHGNVIADVHRKELVACGFRPVRLLGPAPGQDGNAHAQDGRDRGNGRPHQGPIHPVSLAETTTEPGDRHAGQ
jgi:hypothetical protein